MIISGEIATCCIHGRFFVGIIPGGRWCETFETTRICIQQKTTEDVMPPGAWIKLNGKDVLFVNPSAGLNFFWQRVDLLRIFWSFNEPVTFFLWKPSQSKDLKKSSHKIETLRFVLCIF